MSRSGGGGALRLLAEFLVIIAGVLIALGAEAWWDGREEAAAEREFLLLVRTELVDLQEEFQEALDSEVEQQEALTAEAVKIQTGDPEAPAMVAFTTSTPEPRIGALREVDAVRGPILRKEPELRAQVGSLVSSTDAGMQLMASFFSDILANLRTTLVPIAEIQGETRAPLTVGDIRGSPQIQAGVSFHLIAHQNRVLQLTSLVEQTTETLEQLDEVLEREGIEVPEPDFAEVGEEG